MASPFENVSPDRKKRIIVIAVSAGVLIGCIAAYVIFSTGKGTLVISDTNVAGETITLNNAPVNGTSESDGLHVSAYPGQYRLKITKQGYQPYVQDLVIAKGQTVTVLPAFAFIPKDSSERANTVQFVQPTPDQQDVLYLGNGGSTLYQMDLNKGIPQAITTQTLQGVQDMDWPANPDVALIQKSDGVYLQEIPTYDFRTQTIRKIAGPDFESVVWDPNDSNRIAAAYYPSTGEQSLIFSDKTGVVAARKADLSGIEKPLLTWSPDSRFIAIVSRASDPAKNHLWLYRLDNGSFTQVSADNGVNGVSFSPDGTSVLYGAGVNQLYTVRTDGSNKKTVPTTGTPAQAAWHDSSSFLLPDSHGTLTLYSLSGSSTGLAYTFSEPSSVQGMFYFSNGKKILFYTKDTIYTINAGI